MKIAIIGFGEDFTIKEKRKRNVPLESGKGAYSPDYDVIRKKI